ncbi:DUF4332 domain-containing protein, partial [bacterium]
AGSVHPSPVSLDKFPGVSVDVVKKLESAGIKNSKQLFHLIKNPDEKKQLIESAQISTETLHEVAGLSDLVRLYGVGPVFSRILYDIGIRSVKAFMSYSPEAIVQRYEDVTKKKADFSARDVSYSLELAKELEIVMREG